MHSHVHPRLSELTSCCRTDAVRPERRTSSTCSSEKAKHIAHLVAACRDAGIATVEPTSEAEAEWTQTIVAMSGDRLTFLETCTPGYYNGEGNVSPQVARSLPYGAGPVAFIELLRQWRAGGDFAGLERDGAHARAEEQMA